MVSLRVDTATAHSEIGIFQNDNDHDTLSEMGHDMGIYELEEKMKATAKASGESDEEVDRIYLSIYGGGSHPDIVRKHLDSGALANLVKVKEARMMEVPDGSMHQRLDYMFRDPCYEYALLGACAMSLGCQLPESFLDMLKIICSECSVPSKALKQMHKALFGPGGFKNGEPYDFESKDLLQTANATLLDNDDDSDDEEFDPRRPVSLLSTISGISTKSVILKELRNRSHNPNVCAACSNSQGKDGGELLQCARCKDRKYCSKACQKEHWKIHKKLCKPVGAWGSLEVDGADG